jgi:hypothetical protein
MLLPGDGGQKRFDAATAMSLPRANGVAPIRQGFIRWGT